MGEQHPEIAITPLGDVSQVTRAARGMLPGRETEPAGEVAGVAVVADFATGGRNHGGGGQQTDAGHGEQFLAGGALFGQHGNPAIMPTV